MAIVSTNWRVCLALRTRSLSPLDISLMTCLPHIADRSLQWLPPKIISSIVESLAYISSERCGAEAMKSYRAILLVVFAILLCSACSAEAGKRKCADNYRRFCRQWGLGTRGPENCMRRPGDQLTHGCVRGLIQAGAVSQTEVDRRRRAAGR